MTSQADGSTRRPIRLRRLVGWGLLGQFAYVIGQFTLLMALAQLATVEDLGRFSYASALILPVYRFFNLGVRVNQATDASSIYRFSEFFALRCVASGVAYIVILAMGFVLVDAETRLIMLVFGAAKGVETFCELFYGSFQKADRIALSARSLALRGLGGGIGFTIMLALTGSLIWAYSTLFAIWFTVAVLVDYPATRRLVTISGNTAPARWSQVWELARSSLTLGVNALLAALQGGAPRFVINFMLGLAALGRFAVIAYAMQASTTVIMAIGQSIVARLSQYVKAGNRHAFMKVQRDVTITLLGSGILCAGVALVVGDWLLATVFGSEYGGLGTLLALAVIAAALSACTTIMQAGLQASRLFSLNTRIRAMSLVTMVLATFAGAYLGGLEGTVIGMALSYGLHATVLFLVLRRLPFSTTYRSDTAPGGAE